MHKALAKIIRPIVEGQVRTWLAAHPEGERHPGHMVSGIGKRITHDICADQTVARIELALGPGPACTPGNGGALPKATIGDAASREPRRATQGCGRGVDSLARTSSFALRFRAGGVDHG